MIGLFAYTRTAHRASPLGVVQADPLVEDAPGVQTTFKFVLMDGLAFERAPQPFDIESGHQPPASAW